jgi:hypothetical protein
MNKGGVHIRVNSDVMIKRLSGLSLSQYAPEVNAMTKGIVSKYGKIVKSNVEGALGTKKGRVINGLHRKRFSTQGLKVGYITENYVLRWLDEGTVDRYTKGRKLAKRTKTTTAGRKGSWIYDKSKVMYRGKYVASKGVFTGQIAQHERAIYADFEGRVNKLLTNIWSKS